MAKNRLLTYFDDRMTVSNVSGRKNVICLLIRIYCDNAVLNYGANSIVVFDGYPDF